MSASAYWQPKQGGRQHGPGSGDVELVISDRLSTANGLFTRSFGCGSLVMVPLA